MLENSSAKYSMKKQRFLRKFYAKAIKVSAANCSKEDKRLLRKLPSYLKRPDVQLANHSQIFC